MKPNEEPERLLDAGDGDVPRLLRAGRSEVPSEAQMAALAARVIGPTGGGGGPSGGGGPGPITVTPASLMPVYIGGGLALAVGTWALVAQLIGPPASAAPEASPRATSVRSYTVPVASAEIAPSPVFSAAPSPSPSATAVAAARSIAASARDAAPVAIADAPAPTEPAPIDPPPAEAPPVATAPPLALGVLTVPTAVASDAPSTETEAQMLRRAQDALASNPASALAITIEHARRFPVGVLGQEREVIAILALQNLGRTAEARTRAAAFAAHFPRSAHLQRLSALLPAAP